MKQFITLVFSLLFVVCSVQAQKIDYDNSSKWFLGFNAGGTWHTTDVRTNVNGGWGITLGRSFNYNYGRLLYFDLRGRYLGGRWEGQDNSVTSLDNYNPENLPGMPLQPYKDSLGITVNNFHTELHNLSGELVIHLNGLRERSGWDPYIFGGIGLKWYQTMGDLYYNDSLGGIYDYASLGDQVNETSLDILNDNIFETALTGSKQDEFSLGVMPSLGFGLGYQVGKRVSIGFEHKTTFTGDDFFDGFENTSVRSKQDLYHYTSMYVQFRFRARGSVGNSSGNSSGNIGNYNSNNNLTNCPAPTVTFRTPSANAQLVSGQIYTVAADIYNVSIRENITFLFNGVSNTNFTFNAVTGRFESNVVLQPGTNSFEIKTFNSCGNAANSITVSYENCNAPLVSLISQVPNGSTVRTPNYQLSAQILNMPFAQGITVQHNNQQISGFNYNQNNLQANIVLQPGNNIITVSAHNQCGTSTQSITLNYQVCNSPVITFQSPAVNNSTVTQQGFTLTATVTNVSGKQNITVLTNGNTLTNFTYSNGRIQSNVNLNPGVNIFSVTATNNCGSVTETISVNYDNCVPPLIVLTTPSTNNLTVTNPSFGLVAQISNANQQGITVTQNGQSLSGWNFMNGTLRVNTTLSSGSNVFIISATNACGTVSQSIVVQYNSCLAPVVAITTPSVNNLTVSQPNYSLQALVSNVNAQGVTISKNGQVIGGSTFANGVLNASVLLVPGANTFVVTAVNDCGIVSESVTVNYVTCTTPVIILTNPAANNSTVTGANYGFLVQVANANAQDITLTQNGLPVSGVSFVNGQLRASLFLNGGPNVLVVTATNDCGTTTETVIINYNNCVPPTISILAPSINNTTVNSSASTFVAQINNVQAQGVSLTLNGQPVANTVITNGQLRANVTLNPGANVFVLTVTNACGTAAETITVNYDNCIPPAVSIVTPATNNTTVTTGSVGFLAQVSNVTAQGVSVTVNGQQTTAVTYMNGQLRGNLSLSAGTNTITVTATNSCGSDTETITITYNNCIAPVLTMVTPVASGTEVTNANYTLLAQLTNVNAQQVTVSQNGANLTPVNLANGQLSMNVTLAAGINTFVITATNDCGNVNETVSVTYNNCIAPTLAILSPNAEVSTVTSQNYTLLAQATNVTSSQISVTMNGQPISGSIFTNGQLRANLSLIPGANTVTVTVTNTCGSVTETTTINYNNCVAPVLNITTPSSNNSSVTNPSLTIVAQTENVTSEQISMTVNGSPSTTFTVTGGQLRSNATLSGGTNTIVITATNVCGSVTETITVNYAPLEIQEQKITICHYPPGNNGNPQTLEIPLSAWPAHQAHGDVLGPCPESNPDNQGGDGNQDNNNNGGGNGQGNGNNGHGNNADGVDSSNPGQGQGGPTGANDPSGNVDDENGAGNGNAGGQSSSGNTGNSSGQPGSGQGSQGSGNGNQDNNNNGGGNGQGNGNNGHGNNADGVDSSNPGQGQGGPTGANDPSGNVDDENGAGNGNAGGQSSSGNTGNSSGQTGSGQGSQGSGNGNNDPGSNTQNSNGSGSNNNENNSGNPSGNGNQGGENSGKGGNGSGNKSVEKPGGGGVKPGVNTPKPAVNNSNKGTEVKPQGEQKEGEKPAAPAGGQGSAGNKGAEKPGGGGVKPAVNAPKPAVKDNKDPETKPEGEPKEGEKPAAPAGGGKGKG